MQNTSDINKDSSKLQLIELLVFLFLIVPSMALSFYSGTIEVGKFPLLAIFTILRDLGLLFLVLFFLWRNGESVALLGWTSKDLWKNIGIGVLLFVPFVIGSGFLEKGLETIGFSTPKVPLRDIFKINYGSEYILAFLLVTVVAIVEETIFRGYLILRLHAVCKNMPAVLFLSSAIFSLGHGYEGSSGVITVGFSGLVLGIVYVWRKSLVTSIVMHFLFDFMGIVLISQSQP